MSQASSAGGHVFGRATPRTRIAALESRLRGTRLARVGAGIYPTRSRPLPSDVTAADWDEQYEAGRWGYLEDLSEIAHYMVIVGFVHYGPPEPSVLDVGCGQGRLAKLLAHAGASSYVGVDLSALAVARAASLDVPNARFEVADGNEWVPDECFDLVIYNESLYYLNNPTEVLTRMAGCLNPGGMLVISMFRFGDIRKLWAMINRMPRLELVDRITVTNANQQTWDVGAYRVASQPEPRASSRPGAGATRQPRSHRSR